LASQLDVLWGTDEDDDGMDDAEFCETIDKLRQVLRPWRQRRVAQQQIASFNSSDATQNRAAEHG
jgi:hypothetical protein